MRRICFALLGCFTLLAAVTSTASAQRRPRSPRGGNGGVQTESGGGSGPPYEVLVLPTGTVTTQYPTLTIEFCKNSSFSVDMGTASILVNSNEEIGSFTITSGDPTGACGGGSGHYQATTTAVAFNVGTNTIEASVCDDDSACGGYTNWNISRTSPPLEGPQITLKNLNGENQDRGLCLTLGAGQSAGLSCGDLFVTHAMPAYRTKGRDRALTLLYSSAQANPRPTVAATIVNASTIATPTSLFARLTVNGTVRDSATFAAVSPGSAKQIVLGFDAVSAGLSTGIYAFTLLVRNTFSGGTRDSTRTGDLLVVNRSTSEFGAGWWVSGLEQLFLSQGSGRILWVGADGSAAVYDSIAANTWRRASGPFRDTLSLSSNVYTRSLRHGIKVQFDNLGRHIRTINRVQDTTSFTWSGSPARLASIQVPPSGASYTTYTVAWDGSSNLDSIADPAGRGLNASISGGTLNALRDTDGDSVRFAYDGNKRMTRRTNRRDFGTSYTYANGLHVTRVRVPLTNASGDSSTTDIAYWDEGGLAMNSPGGTVSPVDTATYTRIDGPRSGVADSVRFWVDRWGAPIRIIGASSDTTLITRSTTTALVSRLEDPLHRIVGMAWDARGNLLTQNDSTHEGHGTGGFQTATTRYTYSSANTADSPDSVIDADGLVTRYKYTTLGLDSIATSPTGQETRFLYLSGASAGLLSSIKEKSVPVYTDTVTWSNSPSTAATDLVTSFLYDALGNGTHVVGALGDTTRYHFNSYTQVDTVVNALGNKTVYRRRPIGVVDSIVTVGSPANRVVTFTYDDNFNRLTLTDPRGVVRTWYYDAADRDTAEANDYGYRQRVFLNAASLADSVRTRRSAVIRNLYDAAGRLTQTVYPAMTAGDTALGDSLYHYYDRAGHDTLSTNRNGSVQRRYYREGTLKYDRQITTAGYGFNVINEYRYSLTDARTWYINYGTASGSHDTLLVRYKYDLGLLDTLVIDYPGNSLANDTAFYSWDGLGRRSQVITPHKATIGWFYDAGGRIRRVYTTNHSCSLGCPTDDSAKVDLRYYSYDLLGRPLWIAQYVGQGVDADSQSYDDFGQMRYQIQGSIRHSYGYDASGNMVADTLNNGYGHIFVMPANHNILANDTAVDNHGRRLMVNYTFDNQLNRQQDLPQVNPSNLRRDMWYDAADHMTSIAAASITSSNRTPDMYEPGADPDTIFGLHSTYDTRTNTCRYDPLGRQVKPCGALAMAFDGHQVVRVLGTRIIYGPSLDDPIAVYDTALGGGSDAKYYAITDGSGHLFSFTGRNGNDERLGHNSLYSDRVEFSGATVRGHRFSGSAAESYASEDMSFFRNRYYDQRTGRWTQEDPVGVAGGLNLFGYVGNNPAAYTDPFGLAPCCLDWRNRLMAIAFNLTKAWVETGEARQVAPMATPAVAHTTQSPVHDAGFRDAVSDAEMGSSEGPLRELSTENVMSEMTRPTAETPIARPSTVGGVRQTAPGTGSRFSPRPGVGMFRAFSIVGFVMTAIDMAEQMEAAKQCNAPWCT